VNNKGIGYMLFFVEFVNAFSSKNDQCAILGEFFENGEGLYHILISLFPHLKMI